MDPTNGLAARGVGRISTPTIKLYGRRFQIRIPNDLCSESMLIPVDTCGLFSFGLSVIISRRMGFRRWNAGLQSTSRRLVLNEGRIVRAEQ